VRADGDATEGVDMDTLAAAIRRAEFSASKRGYDPDAVDAFLADLAEAIASLEDSLRTETLRANALQRRFAVAGDAEDSIEVAYMAAAEAKQKLLGEAETRAAEIVRGAESAAGDVLAEPRREARRIRKEAEDILLQAKARLEGAEAEAARIEAGASAAAAAGADETERTRAEAIAAAEDMGAVARTEAEAVIARAEDEADEIRSAARRDAIAVMESSQRESEGLIAATKQEHQEIVTALATLRAAVGDMLRSGVRDSETIRIVVDSESADLRLAESPEEAVR